MIGMGAEGGGCSRGGHLGNRDRRIFWWVWTYRKCLDFLGSNGLLQKKKQHLLENNTHSKIGVLFISEKWKMFFQGAYSCIVLGSALMDNCSCVLICMEYLFNQILWHELIVREEGSRERTRERALDVKDLNLTYNDRKHMFFLKITYLEVAI